MPKKDSRSLGGLTENLGDLPYLAVLVVLYVAGIIHGEVYLVRFLGRLDHFFVQREPHVRLVLIIELWGRETAISEQKML